MSLFHEISHRVKDYVLSKALNFSENSHIEDVHPSVTIMCHMSASTSRMCSRQEELCVKATGTKTVFKIHKIRIRLLFM